ncbi:MAG: hypothetical protein WDZ77_02845 [Candidatus Pacearchaeota archaeon]
MANIHQIIGKVNPKQYAENGKELLAKYKSPDEIPANEVKPQSLETHSIIYDSATETLEPIYFFILDLINDFGYETEKIVDNFSSSPGSGYFSELGQRGTIMQQQGTKILGDINTVLRSVLNITYDLRDFRTRLKIYEDLKSNDKNESAILSLKQIWIDRVDISKGNSSLKAMAFQGGFQTLLDAFLVAKDVKDVDKIDLNDRVKRILRPRIHEFNVWLQESEKELKKRYELEKNYLRSQVNSLKLYSRWVKPYLKAAGDLETTNKFREPALVKTFNTVLLELTLFGKNKIDVEKASVEGIIPEDLKKLKMERTYFSCVLIDFNFRGIPQRVGQQSHYAFGGRAEITFNAYALNEDEIAKVNEELAKADVEDVLGLIEGGTTDSLDILQKEIDSFLEEEDFEDSEEKSSGLNPFSALFGFYNKKPKEEKEKKTEKGPIKVKPEDWIEKTHLRPLAEVGAKEDVFDLFDTYKGSHGMESYT